MCSRRGQATMKSKRSQAAAGLGAEKAEVRPVIKSLYCINRRGCYIYIYEGVMCVQRCGDSKENPIVIMESPLTRLNPSKLLSTPVSGHCFILVPVIMFACV